MSAIDTYTKYNLHSAAPYIGGGKCPGMQRRGKRLGEGNIQAEVSGGNVLHPNSVRHRVIPCQLNKCSPPKILDFSFCCGKSFFLVFGVYVNFGLGNVEEFDTYDVCL